ncbi:MULTISPECIES: hypothetical protein [Streptomyces]|uniref:LuxR family transcriptional regulator n=1 Tax=Streptomyces gancidicus BKS 13-15 TaxID=1284664 RepID=M3CRM3_STREZ|nr:MULTISPECIES: hypothetical protein [Streptomyces]EMF20185.1 LuxR family transcriptional regulator [Streptomyces gancidicus BKS 13-15]
MAHEAQGNPLALLEFAGSTGTSGDRHGQGAGRASGPGRDVRALYGARVGRLPRGTREVLLLAALEGSGDIGVLEAAGGPGSLEELAAAERDHLRHGMCTVNAGTVNAARCARSVPPPSRAFLTLRCG